MSIRFNMDEIFELAEMIETNGANYYRKAAEIFSDQNIKKLLSGLSEMENSHKIIFHAMRTELKENDKAAVSVTSQDKDQVAPYLRTLADSKIFNIKDHPSKKLSGNETLAQIFNTALNMEKDSIVFYLGMKEIIPEKLGKNKIDGIIKEEMNHIIILNETWASLASASTI